MKYKVVAITNNLDDYPLCEEDTLAHPHLVGLVSDELDVFIIDEDGNACLASEFFYEHGASIRWFETIE